jgi:hypothetical protein
MRGNFFRGVVLGSLTAVLVLGASAALAGTGVGGVFNLGKSNTVNQASSLTGSSSGSQLTISNTSTGSGTRGLTVSGASSSAALLAQNSAGPAAYFQSSTSAAPFLVNSSVEVPSLNASLLGGHASSYFLPTTSRTTFTTAKGPSVNVAPGSTEASSALCPSGWGAVGSGFLVTAGGPGYVQGIAFGTDDGTTLDGFVVEMLNPSQNINNLTFHAEAVCANQTIKLPGG